MKTNTPSKSVRCEKRVYNDEESDHSDICEDLYGLLENTVLHRDSDDSYSACKVDVSDKDSLFVNFDTVKKGCNTVSKTVVFCYCSPS